jgi:arsenical-resistance protein 2
MQAKLPWLSASYMLIHRSINVFNTALARRHSKISTITMTSAQPAKWFDSLPTPVSDPAQLSATDLHELFQSNETRAKVLVVDVRRADIEVGIPFVCCSQDLTRQGRSSMYDPKRDQPPRPDIPPDPTDSHLYPEPVRCNSPDEAYDRYSHVVFHCSSSNGRGPRCAAWYEDALVEKGIKTNAYVLTGGIKKWIELYPSEVVRV